MFSTTTRLALLGDRHQLPAEILLEAGPDPLVGVSQKVWQSIAEHQVDCLQDRSARSSRFDLELSERQRDGSELPVSISLSRDPRGVLLDHGGA